MMAEQAGKTFCGSDDQRPSNKLQPLARYIVTFYKFHTLDRKCGANEEPKHLLIFRKISNPKKYMAEVNQK